MFRHHSQIPDGVPVLSPGRHRNPRRGACFMEFASYLAGERWSDHPACTHALLASLARTVNDLVDNTHRAELVSLIPDVVGLTGDDPVIDVTIAARAGCAAFPVASQEDQRAIAVGLRTTDRLAATLDHPSIPALRRDIADALALDPSARRFAEQFPVQQEVVQVGTFRKQTAPRMVHVCGVGIARAVVLDPDDRLVALLRQCVGEVRALTTAVAPEPNAVQRPAADSRRGVTTR